METINGEKVRGIYKRGSTYWIRYADVDGSIKFESAKTNKIEIAIVFLAQRKKGVEELTPMNSLTLKLLNLFCYLDLFYLTLAKAYGYQT